MKRLFIVASLAIMAVGCQKTEVQNEVLTPIGFNAETGKATRAIMSNSYENDHSFGVVAYLNDANETGDAKIKLFIPNMEITNQGTEEAPKWKNAEVTYYWPNDPDNNIDFYAYSPFGVGATVTNKGTFELANYEHKNYYGDAAVDFMVATPVLKAVYTAENEGVVPVEFHHEMTQVKFVVSENTADNVEVKLYSITINKATKIATYTNAVVVDYKAGTWATEGATQGNVIAFPLGAETEGTIISTTKTVEGKVTKDNRSLTSTSMTMIPHTPESITVEYGIIVNGVEEKVNQTFSLPAGADNANLWGANKSITYNLTIGLNEITFEPSVKDWATNIDVVPVPVEE